ncbi:MAG TPA: DUF6762 family protein [Peptostreptococcaceae bacterium]|nr:DUF6762 family protein [Peptostreptococcaceae bacterium]
MEPLSVLIMQKNKETGYLESELGSYTVSNNGNLIDNIYMVHENEKDIVHLKLTTERDVEDWEFSEILDYYDEDILKDSVLSFEEVEDAYNPTWEVTFEFVESQNKMQDKLQDILNKHKIELDEIYNEIKKEE